MDELAGACRAASALPRLLLRNHGKPLTDWQIAALFHELYTRSDTVSDRTWHHEYVHNGERARLTGTHWYMTQVVPVGQYCMGDWTILGQQFTEHAVPTPARIAAAQAKSRNAANPFSITAAMPDWVVRQNVRYCTRDNWGGWGVYFRVEQAIPPPMLSVQSYEGYNLWISTVPTMTKICSPMRCLVDTIHACEHAFPTIPKAIQQYDMEQVRQHRVRP